MHGFLIVNILFLKLWNTEIPLNQTKESKWDLRIGTRNIQLYPSPSHRSRLLVLLLTTISPHGYNWIHGISLQRMQGGTTVPFPSCTCSRRIMYYEEKKRKTHRRMDDKIGPLLCAHKHKYRRRRNPPIILISRGGLCLCTVIQRDFPGMSQRCTGGCMLVSDDDQGGISNEMQRKNPWNVYVDSSRQPPQDRKYLPPLTIPNIVSPLRCYAG